MPGLRARTVWPGWVRGECTQSQRARMPPWVNPFHSQASVCTICKTGISGSGDGHVGGLAGGVSADGGASLTGQLSCPTCGQLCPRVWTRHLVGPPFLWLFAAARVGVACHSTALEDTLWFLIRAASTWEGSKPFCLYWVIEFLKTMYLSHLPWSRAHRHKVHHHKHRAGGTSIKWSFPRIMGWIVSTPPKLICWSLTARTSECDCIWK